MLAVEIHIVKNKKFGYGLHGLSSNPGMVVAITFNTTLSRIERRNVIE
jgi:hypothetical protein